MIFSNGNELVAREIHLRENPERIARVIGYARVVEDVAANILSDGPNV